MMNRNGCSNKRCPDKVALAVMNAEGCSTVIDAIALELVISRKEAEELFKRNQNIQIKK